MHPPVQTFTDLFRLATGKPQESPFPYQVKFATDGTSCPEVVHAPTGAGKTATAILGWLWRRRFHADLAVRKATPRRLVYCLPMRVLVEQTFGEAIRWLHRLQLLDAPPGFVPDTPQAGKSYQPHFGQRTEDEGKIAVHLLMGGEPRRDWDLYPERDAILIGTQDMLLSRALNRGYGMGRFRWPMHYGLLNTDSLWVFDEVQLMSVGLATSTQLQAFRSSGKDQSARSVWMSATLVPRWFASADFRDRVPDLQTLRLDEKPDELDTKAPGLEERWVGEKPIQAAGLSTDDKNMDKVAEFVGMKHQPGSLTLVIVNTVDRSRLLYAALGKRFEAGVRPKRRSGKAPATPGIAPAPPELKLIHSRFRPHERAEWMGWLTAGPSSLPAAGRIVISTQVVEAGVDLSARTLITELAPWPSLVQRFGRCNRRGEFGQKSGNPAQVFWLDVPTVKESGAEKKPKSLAPPYSDAELNAARTHLGTLTDAGLKSLHDFFAARTDDQRNGLFPYNPTHVIRRKDAVELFDTTTDLAGSDIDVSRFIRDGEELDVQVFWRTEEPQPKWTRAELRRRAPRREELCPVPFVRFRDDFLAKGKLAFRLDPLDGRWKKAAPAAVYPGQVYWVPASQGGYDRDLGWWPAASTVPRERLLEPAGPDEENKAETGYDADEESEGVWQTVAEHTDDVCVELRAVAGNLHLTADELEVLRVAARWHDWGKAHDIFQRAVPRRDVDAGRLLAKAPGRWADYERPHFRHELASALAVLATLARTDAVPDDWKRLLDRAGLADLAVYLIAAHHGKVRLSIRSLPGETKPPVTGAFFARGVWEGDGLPEVDLGGGATTPVAHLDLSPMQLGTTDGQPSWAERMLGVRDQFGPLRVAYLEAILRAADMRASRAANLRKPEAEHA